MQPQALRTLFSVDTRKWYAKHIFDDYIYAYRFAVSTGLRPGELVGLWYGDIKGNTVNLRRSVNVEDETTTGKNENSIRSFDMCQQAREAYEAQVQLLKDSGVQLNYNTPLFQIPCQRSLKRRWEKYQDGNGITPRITLYELRHTFVSVEAGELTDGQLKMLVGHSPEYGHVRRLPPRAAGPARGAGGGDDSGTQKGSRVGHPWAGRILTQFLTQFIFLDATKGFACIASYLHKNNLLSFNPLHNLRVPVEFPLFDSHYPLQKDLNLERFGSFLFALVAGEMLQTGGGNATIEPSKR